MEKKKLQTKKKVCELFQSLVWHASSKALTISSLFMLQSSMI